MSDTFQDSVALHKKYQGKLKISGSVQVENATHLSLVYTPGVAQVSRVIKESPNKSFDLTWRGRLVAVVSDGSAVLGLGNIGPEAAMPVMEGKSLLMSKFAGVDSVPIVTSAHTAHELVTFVRQIAPSFGAINLEDIASPICLEVEDRLQDLGIPVFHDDQHGTAIVVRAAIMNAAQVVGKKFEDLKIVISGAGAAGLAIAQLLLGYERQGGELSKIDDIQKVSDVMLIDSHGLINAKRADLTDWKSKFAMVTNHAQFEGGLEEAVRGADVFVGVSKGGILTREMVRSMAQAPIILALANPDPEILPDEAVAAGAAIVATGRSDYPNQVNNSLAFPGIFRGALDSRATRITTGMKLAASRALTTFTPTETQILPSMFESEVATRVARAVAEQARIEGVVRSHK